MKLALTPRAPLGHHLSQHPPKREELKKIQDVFQETAVEGTLTLLTATTLHKKAVSRGKVSFRISMFPVPWVRFSFFRERSFDPKAGGWARHFADFHSITAK